eukprot:TRINITY_DN7186_c0_g2_i3.p2 TRINITY_DN7186_c0_g2~~TRINITY_DN7186_c0_g2_i3.p2  ORF type:complete len:254 (-),score=-14.85 TRINITY_DN7186_c0_g2_i3:33-794(-)
MKLKEKLLILIKSRKQITEQLNLTQTNKQMQELLKKSKKQLSNYNTLFFFIEQPKNPLNFKYEKLPKQSMTKNLTNIIFQFAQNFGTYKVQSVQQKAQCTIFCYDSFQSNMRLQIKQGKFKPTKILPIFLVRLFSKIQQEQSMTNYLMYYLRSQKVFINAKKQYKLNLSNKIFSTTIMIPLTIHENNVNRIQQIMFVIKTLTNKFLKDYQVINLQIPYLPVRAPPSKKGTFARLKARFLHDKFYSGPLSTKIY